MKMIPMWIFVLLTITWARNVLGLSNVEGKLSSSWYLSDFCNKLENDSSIELSSVGKNSGGILAFSHQQPYYTAGKNCTIHLIAPSSYTILLSFSQVDTRNCSLDKITVSGSQKPLCGQSQCPKENCSEYTGSRIELNFSSGPLGTVPPKMVGFNSIVTAFVKTNGTNKCPDVQHFKCRNLRCIWRGFYCNGHNNCGDGSDEPSHCPAKDVWGILVIIFGAVCFCIFLPVFCFLVIWGGRLHINTTTSKYQPIVNSDGSINNQDGDELPFLTESDILFASSIRDHYGTMRPHSNTFTYGTSSATVLIHTPTKNTADEDKLSKSLGKGDSLMKC